MARVRWTPWTELSTINDQMDRMYQQIWQPRWGAIEGAVSHLPVDVRENEDAYVVEASVPGFAPDEVEVTFDEGLLTIAGTKDENSETPSEGYLRRERHHGSFRRVLQFPEGVNADGIVAAFENGVLTVTLPRMGKTAPKRIPISVEAGKSLKQAQHTEGSHQ